MTIARLLMVGIAIIASVGVILIDTPSYATKKQKAQKTRVVNHIKTGKHKPPRTTTPNAGMFDYTWGPVGGFGALGHSGGSSDRGGYSAGRSGGPTDRGGGGGGGHR
jgi:hypothetical protein